MSLDRETILTAALALPQAERAEIVHELLDSLSPEIDDAESELTESELDRRVLEFENGTDPGISRADLKREP